MSDLLRIMPFPHSWVHILPQVQPGAASSHAFPIGGHNQQAAHDFLRACQDVSDRRGLLPTLEQLPNTTFCVNPENKAESAIIFLHPHHPGRTVGYCLLRADNHEAMNEIAARYSVYATSSASQTAGNAPLERMSQEVFDQITKDLWNNEGLWHEDKDIKSLAAVSTTIRSRLVGAQKVIKVESQMNMLLTSDVEDTAVQLADIASYALSDNPVKLVNEQLLAAFKYYVQAFVAASNDDRRTRFINSGAIIDTAAEFIVRLKSDHDVARAFSLLNDCPEPIFNGFTRQISDTSAEKLLGIVTKMKDHNAKAASIAALGNLLRLSGPTDRRKIQYVKPLLDHAQDLNVADEVLKNIGLVFLDVRMHLAIYCARHYDPSYDLYSDTQHGDEDNDENKKIDLQTGRSLDAFLTQNNFDLTQLGGRSRFARAIEPLWEKEPPDDGEFVQ